MRLILIGACGRMGREVSALCKERGVIIAAGVDLVPAPTEYPVYASISEVREDADAVVDFSSAEGLAERLAYCKAHGLGIVLAATGYSEEDETLVRAYSKELPVFKTGNLSVGVSVLRLLAKRAAQALGEGFDVEIIERHHNQKKDAPSGTALMLAKSVDEGLGGGSEYVFARHGMVGARKKSEIGIHAVRGGTIVGEHEVMFAGEDEVITLTHTAQSRKIFAVGALKAAQWLIGRPAGLYDMDDLLGGII